VVGKGVLPTPRPGNRSTAFSCTCVPNAYPPRVPHARLFEPHRVTVRDLSYFFLGDFSPCRWPDYGALGQVLGPPRHEKSQHCDQQCVPPRCRRGLALSHCRDAAGAFVPFESDREPAPGPIFGLMCVIMLARIFEPTAVPSSAHCLKKSLTQRLDREAAAVAGCSSESAGLSPWPGHDTRWLARGLPRFHRGIGAKGQPAPTSFEHKPPAGCSPSPATRSSRLQVAAVPPPTRTVRPGYRAIRQSFWTARSFLTQL